MDYAVMKGTTPMGGSSERVIVREYDTKEAAVEALKRRWALLEKAGAELFGTQGDFHVVRSSGKSHVLEHYWVEDGRETTTFELGPEETERLHEFCRRHHPHARSGAAGEWLRVSFVPTGLGILSWVECLSSGATEELSDSANW